MIDVSVKRQYIIPTIPGTSISYGAISSGGSTTIINNVSTYADVNKAYVDGSLAIRDAFNATQDSSIVALRSYVTDLSTKTSYWKSYTDSSLGLRDTSIAWLYTNKVNKAGDTMTGDLTVNTNVIVKGKVNADYFDSSLAYVSGFAGSGFQLKNTAGEITLELDNLKVRKKLSAYELEINEISSIGGGLIVSVANGIPYSVSGTRFYFDTDGNSNPIQFAVNDYVRAQVWTGDSTGNYVGLVTNVVQSATLGSAYIDATTVSGTPWSKMKLVQIGNSSDTARQNLIYITAADTNNPYIDMLSGVNGGSFAGKQKLRIGNLSGITDAAFGGALSGYGLYADNIYLKGQIIITSGSVPNSAVTGLGALALKGSVDLSSAEVTNKSLANVDSTANSKLSGIAAGATVGATWGTNITSQPTTLAGINSTEGSKLSGIAAGATNTTNTNQLTDGANLGGTATWSGISSKPVRFADTPSGAGLCMTASYMGYYDGGAWKSYIDNGGNCKFVGVAEIGTSTASYGGDYGGNSNVAIKGADIYENAVNGQSSLYINRIGYNGGTTQWRALELGDGKGGSHMSMWYNTNTQYYWGIQMGSLKGQVGNEDYTDRRLRYYGTSWFYGGTYFGQNVDFGTYCNTTAAGTHTAANFILNSDERLKENIKPISTALPVNAQYKQFNLKSDPTQKRYGVIAQSLQKAHPELVRADSNGMLSVAYIDLLIKEVAYLKDKVAELEGRIG